MGCSTLGAVSLKETRGQKRNQTKDSSTINQKTYHKLIVKKLIEIM